VRATLDLDVKVRILVVDNEYLMRQGLRMLFAEETGMQIACESENLTQALALLDSGQYTIDVIMLNVTPLAHDIIGTLRKIINKYPLIKIVVLSSYSSKAFITELLHTGIHGYVAKHNTFETLLEAIQTVTSGSTYLCRSAQMAILEEYSSIDGHSESNKQIRSRLNKREYRIMQLLCEGKTAKQIAHNLELSSKTIDASRRQIMHKLGVHSLAELVKYAIMMGITQAYLPVEHFSTSHEFVNTHLSIAEETMSHNGYTVSVTS
jgi:two-component system, NarL family, response regulator LiaR